MFDLRALRVSYAVGRRPGGGTGVRRGSLSPLGPRRASPAAAACALVLLILAGCQRSGSAGPGYDQDQVEAIREALARSVEPAEAEDRAAESDAASPTGWAALRGRVRLVGEPPEDPQVAITSDKEMCAPGGKPVFAKEIVVGADGGLKNVAIYLASEISPEEPWTHPDAQTGQPGDVLFDQKQCVFLSHVAAMRVGQTLLIRNSDTGGHNTQINSKKNPPFNQTIPAGATVHFRPARAEPAGPVLVKCSIHPWMTAHLLIHGNGYFAVTNDAGEFEIPNLPAGVPLEFRIWHERPGYLSGVEIAGSTVTKGRFTLTLDPQDPSTGQLDIQVDASQLTK